VNPDAGSEVLEGIRTYMEDNGLERIEDFHQFLPRPLI
jgi:hypothetical protein